MCSADQRPHTAMCPCIAYIEASIAVHLALWWTWLNQSINQSTRIYIAPYVAGESEARTGLG